MNKKRNAQAIAGRLGGNFDTHHSTVARDPLHAFISAMRAEGITPANPEAIEPGGRLCRFHIEGDKRGSLNGWAVLYLDGLPAGAFGSWKHGIVKSWCAIEKDRQQPAQRAAYLRRMEQTRDARLQEEKRRHAEAAQRAYRIWNESAAADPSHAYLITKGVRPLGLRRRGNALVLPVLSFEGRLASLQFIDPEGGKKLLAGGAKRGNFIPVYGEMPGARRILVCEGWATGATLASLEPESLVIAAIDAGNLQPVAMGARRRWPHAEIVICCDADPAGLSKGRAAAIAASAMVAAPSFPEGAMGTDFNDLAAILAKGAA